VVPSYSVAKRHHFIEPLIAYAIRIACKSPRTRTLQNAVCAVKRVRATAKVFLSMTFDDMPEDREYTPSHEWVRIDGESAVVGITACHSRIAGKILRVKLPEISSAAKTGDIVATIYSTSGEREVRAPISGTVLDINRNLETNPQPVVDDPYAEGWLFRLKIEAGEELEHLLEAKLYREQVRVEETLDVESP
jgi:glycine cleavage system H protein